MQHVEIDFEVYKVLTNLRESEGMTYNDVLRRVLGLSGHAPTTPASSNGVKPWVTQGTSFPAGSEFTTTYKGQTYTGVVKDGELELSDGKRFTSPSAAAIHITGSNVNGWRFWRCKLPGSFEPVLIERLRGQNN